MTEGTDPTFSRPPALQAPEYDAVLAGTHNESYVDRGPLVAARCRQLRSRLRG